MDTSDPVRIVIVGKTGSGKSSLANTIFGEELFETGHTFNSQTSVCQAETKSVSGRNITLIDPPGFFDTERSEEELKHELVRCITECAPGPHAFLSVLKVEKYTKQEEAVIKGIQQQFSKEALKYATLLFTHGDQLPEGTKIEELVCQSKTLSALVKVCGGRCHVIDNKYWKGNPTDEYRNNQVQVEELLKSVGKMMRKNTGGYYTNEKLQEVENEIQHQMELIKQSSPEISETEIREQAKVKAFEKLWNKWESNTFWEILTYLFGVVTGAFSSCNIS